MGFIRLALALCVFASHLDAFRWLHPRAGEAAVVCFFVLSGHVLAYVYEAKFVTSKSLHSDAFRFYYIRWRNLFPAYAVAVLGYLLLIVLQSVRSGIPYRPLDMYLTEGLSSPRWLQIGFLAANISLIWLNALGWRALIDPPTWTLGIESMFWLCLVPLMRLRSRSLAYLWLALQILEFWWAEQQSPFLHFQYFLLGMLVYRFSQKTEEQRGASSGFRSRFSWIVAPIVTLVIVATGSASIYFAPVWIALCLPFVAMRMEASRFDNFAGLLSYPFYLVHVPCINITTVLLHRHAGNPVSYFFAAVALCVGLAAASVITVSIPRRTPTHLYKGWKEGKKRRGKEPRQDRGAVR